MEQSNTSLLECVNKVLENIGERRVTALSSPVSRKCVQALNDSVLDLATITDWEWLKESITAVSWTNETADLGDTQRIHGVAVGDTSNGFINIPWIDEQAFDTRPLQMCEQMYEIPCMYTHSGYNKIRVNPYPVTAAQQARFKFYVTHDLVPPTLPEGKFPIPERFMSLIIYRACHYMCLSHLDDAQGATQWAQQYEALAMRLRNRERGIPSHGTNMFKLRGRRRF